MITDNGNPKQEATMTTEGSETGTIIFSREDAYGFIKPDGAGPDAYLNNAVVEQSGLALRKGDRVKYASRPDRFDQRNPFVIWIERLQ